MAFDGVGMLLLLAAAHQTGLIAALSAALPCARSPWLQQLLPLTRLRLLLTLLFLCAVGLGRTWDLRGYTGRALACVTGRLVAYGYRSAERFLSQLARADADRPLTDALARWTGQLWSPWRDGVPLTPDYLLPAAPDDPFEPLAPDRTVVYVDSHRKPLVWLPVFVTHRLNFIVAKSSTNLSSLFIKSGFAPHDPIIFQIIAWPVIL